VTEPVLRPQTIILAYWLIIILLAAFFLRLACGLCRTALPSWRKSIFSVVFVTFMAYLTFDFSAYLLMRSLEGVGLQVPSWYSYNFWFREPIGLKLYIISHTGLFRYAPFVLALFAATVLQLIILQAEVKFGVSLLIVLMQCAATFVAGKIVALLFGLALVPPGAIQNQQASAQTATGPPPAEQPPQARRRGARRARPARGQPAPAPPQVARAPEQPPVAPATPEPDSLQIFPQDVKEAVVTSRAYLENAGQNLKDYADSHLDELKEDLAPYTKHLPQPVQNFLDKGGWWVVLGALAVIALMWVRSILSKLRRLGRRSKRKKKRPKAIDPYKLKENLAMIGDAQTEEGPTRLLVKGLPARLRLVILSLGNRSADGLNEEMADRILDWIKPGLAQIASGDYPRVRTWPPFYNADGFAAGFAKNVAIPEAKGTRSHWVLVAGQVKIGVSVINVGLAFYADEESTLRNLTVKRDRWLDVLSVEKADRLVGAR
jgi:hypothetical protein